MLKLVSQFSMVFSKVDGLCFQGDIKLKHLCRKLRDEAEEEDRKEIDIEEKKYQAQKRQKAIEKAKSDQYFESDRLKAFRVENFCNYYVVCFSATKY